MPDKRLNAAAARALAWLLERHSEDGTAMVSDGFKEVVIVFRDRKPPDPDDLKAVHKKLLEVLTSEPKSARTLCRESDYSLSSLTLVRKGLSDLVAAGRATHTRDGYSKSTL